MSVKQNKVLDTRVRNFPDCFEKKSFLRVPSLQLVQRSGQNTVSVCYCVVLADGPEDTFPRSRMAFP